MFERFTDAAREVIVDAQAEAFRLHHGWIGCEHLLLALTRRPSRVGSVLAAFGATTATVEAAIREIIGVAVSDSEALASIGIDLDDVRARAEASFGRGALERVTTTKAKRRWRRRRSRQCWNGLTPRFGASAGLIPFTPRAKRCLEIAASTAAPDLVRPKHLAVALTTRADTLAGTVLERLGADIPALGAELGTMPDGL